MIRIADRARSKLACVPPPDAQQARPRPITMRHVAAGFEFIDEGGGQLRRPPLAPSTKEALTWQRSESLRHAWTLFGAVGLNKIGRPDP